METLIDESKLKNLLKEAIVEVLEERKDIFYNLFSDAIEDIALVNAIKEGEKTKSVSREQIFKILNRDK